jgi:hypothetical protein
LRMPRGYGGPAILWRKDIDTTNNQCSWNR